MTKKNYSLSEVAKLLKKQPYQISYVISSGHISEPKLRFAGKRMFSEPDVEKLREHFQDKKLRKEKK